MVFPVTPAKPVVSEAGELVEATTTPRRTLYFSEGEQRELARLITHAVTWNYKVGWIGHSFKGMFHRWPCGMRELEAMVATERAKQAAGVSV